MSTAAWAFDPSLRLAPSGPARPPLSGVDCIVRLSKIDGRRLGPAAVGEAEDGAEVVDDRLEATGGEPAPGLLIDRRPGREVRRQVAPGGAAADEPPRRVEDVAEVMGPLWPASSGSRQRYGTTNCHSASETSLGQGMVGDHNLNYVGHSVKVHNTL